MKRDKKWVKFLVLFLFLCTSADVLHAQDSTFINVHFLYGSKPKRAFKAAEKKWFGGKLGGHVGIETDDNRIIDFIPSGEFHYFAKDEDFHSKFVIHTQETFWQLFGSSDEDVKKMSIQIPISAQQKTILDSISNLYLSETPYDYAFFGMRCGAAGYDILSKIGVTKKYSHRKTYLKIFYPKKLRKRLRKMAEKEGWKIETHEGSERRKWERG